MMGEYDNDSCSNCKYLHKNMRYSNIGIGFCYNEDSDCYMDRVFEDEKCNLFKFE